MNEDAKLDFLLVCNLALWSVRLEKSQASSLGGDEQLGVIIMHELLNLHVNKLRSLW